MDISKTARDTLHMALLTLPVGDYTTAQIARIVAGASTSTPVEIVPGNSAPAEHGERAYHTTPSGQTIVHHPNAYKWRTLYHHSTLRVTVGERWIQQAIKRGGYRRDNRHGVSAAIEIGTRQTIHGYRVQRCYLYPSSGAAWIVQRGNFAYHAHGDYSARVAVRRAIAAQRRQISADRQSALDARRLLSASISVQALRTVGACDPGITSNASALGITRDLETRKTTGRALLALAKKHRRTDWIAPWVKRCANIA